MKTVLNSKFKIQNSKWLLLAALCAACVFTGCSTKFGQALDKTFFTPTAWKTNYIEQAVVVVKTNTVTIITHTNEAGAVVGTTTNVVPVLVNVTVPAHTEVAPVAWAPNPATTGTVSFLGGFAGPYGELASVGLGALLAVIAAVRGKRYKDAAISLAQGVQHTIEALPQNKDAILTAQKGAQNADGTRDTVRALIENFVDVRTP